MSRQHPWPHETGNRIVIFILVSEILDHCQNLLDDPHITYVKTKAQISCCAVTVQCLCFRYIYSTVTLLSKAEISCLQPSSVAVQLGLCRTWLETPKTFFLQCSSFIISILNSLNFLAH